MSIHQDGWQSFFQRISRLWGVFTVGLLLALAPIGPGPAWIYVSAAVIVALVHVLTNHETARWWLSQLRERLGFIGMTLRYEWRCLELGQVAHELNRALKALNHPTLSEEDLGKISAGPTADTKDDLAVCCASFAERLYGESHPVPMAQVLEVLYCDAYAQESVSLWQEISPEQRRELARILVHSERLPELESQDRMVDLVAAVLDRLPGSGFKLQKVVDELCAMNRLWLHLSGYAGCLRAAGIPAMPSVDALRQAIDQELAPGLFLASEYERVAKSVLLGASGKWIRRWAKEEGVPECDARSLEVVGLGIFSATSPLAALCKPVLAPLGGDVAGKPEALGMLLAYLWSRSRPQEEACGDQNLAGLARNWRIWLAEAVAGMGRGVKEEMDSVLKSDLNNSRWPTCLPIQRTTAQIVQQSEQIHGMLEKLTLAQERDAAWRQEMQAILAWAGRAGEPAQRLDPGQLIASVTSAVGEKLRTLNPPAPVATGGTVPELKENLESFAERFRPETRLPVYLDAYAPASETLASFRERAARLGRKLEDLSDLLLAEVGGARGYVITFDQSRGWLADLIDELRDLYGFEHYTRYARIGVLRQGEMFEDFYKRFISDLEKELWKAIATASPGEWEQIEVTVQQISLPHRHDFVADATEKLKEWLPEDRILTKVFRVPPRAVPLAAA